MSSFSSATCHELKTLPRLKNTTDTRTLSPNQCSPSQHVMKLKLFQKQRMQQMQQLSLSLSKPMSSPFISLKTCQTLVFLPLKHPKLESILVYKHPWMFFSLKSIFVVVATVTSAFFLILQAK